MNKVSRFYKVCRKPDDSYGYRGLQRLGPYPPNSEKCDAALFAACMDYIQNNQRTDVADDARELWRSLGDARDNFEIIRVEAALEDSECDTAKLLGYDVVEQGGWNSLLAWDWFSNAPSWEDETPSLVLMRLIFEYFGPRLNSNQMFQNYSDAIRIARAATALGNLAPGTFESPEAGAYQIWAIYFESVNP